MAGTGLKDKLYDYKSKLEKVHVEEIGEDVYFKRLDGHGLEQYQSAQLSIKDVNDTAILGLHPLLLSLTICDEKGKMVFDNPDEAKKVNGALLSKLALISAKVNGLTQEARAEIEKKV